MRRYADGNQIPWVVFRKGDRKLEVVRPYLDAAEQAGQSTVVAIGEAREFQWVFDATKKDGPDGVPWFRFYRTERLVTCYYFYIHDRRMGAAFIKVCCYAPYPVKVWCLWRLPHKTHYAAAAIMRSSSGWPTPGLFRWCSCCRCCRHNQSPVRKASRESGGW